MLEGAGAKNQFDAGKAEKGCKWIPSEYKGKHCKDKESMSSVIFVFN